jgi:NTE family protein
VTRLKIGLALGSGGARGWCHVGVLQTLLQAGIEPHCVAGCSMGAFVAAAYLTGGLDDLEKSARAITWRTIASFLDINVVHGGLIDGRRIPTMLGPGKEAITIEALAKPFTAIATDLRSGREIWLQSGRLVDAVRASIAMPGILSPVRLDGRWLLDGGMTNPVPVSACRAMGADIIVAVNPNAHVMGPGRRPQKREAEAGIEEETGTGALSSNAEILDQFLSRAPDGVRQALSTISRRFVASTPEAPGYFDILSTSISIMTDQIMRSRLAGEPPHVLVRPQLRHVSTLEFNRAAEAIEEGSAAMQRQLPMLMELIS